jgi:integrase
MPRRALTDRLIQSLTSNGKLQHEHFDGFCSGLVLRVSRAGGKVWDFTFRNPVDGKRARLRIGPYPAISLATARDRAMQAGARIATGKDPRVEDDKPSLKTIAELHEDRMALVVRGKARSADEIERRAIKYIIPKIGNVAVIDFRIDPHYNAVVDPLILRNKLRTAGILFQDLRALMNFGIQRGVLEYSRLHRLKRPDQPKIRTRYLSLDEIRIVWNRLPEVMYRSDHIPTILKICLLLLQRISEVAGMRRSEINQETWVWTIPAARTKNKHDHAVPLSPTAIALIREAMRRTNGDIIFPDRAGAAPLGHRAIDCAVRLAQETRKGRPLGKFGIPRFRCHDLRRTGGTHMSAKANGLQISKMDRAHVLNHRSVTASGITDEVYNQNNYMDEKAAALALWDAFLMRLLINKPPNQMAAD